MSTDRANRALLRTAVLPAALAAALVAPGVAQAHPRSATVALDYRLTLDHQVPGVQTRILDGDRALRLTVPRGTSVVVLGDLGEPMLRFADGVWVNEASPTAQANKLIIVPGKGWKRLSHGTTFAWHEHRLAPPPFEAGRYGTVAQWSVPLLVNGRHAAVGGAFVRVARPQLWLWAGGILAIVLAGWVVLRSRPQLGVPLTVAAGALAGLGALVAETAFTLRDSPSGRVSWVPIGVAAVVTAVASWLLVSGRGSRRAYVAGAIGAGVAALTLSWLGVFFHGAVVAALPGIPVRVACGLALAAGLLALVGSLSIRVEDER